MYKAIFLSLFFSLAVNPNIYAQTLAEKNSDIVKAIFAGGCFWCMEKPYDKQDGVISTLSGYSGGPANTANYKKVSRGGSGHYEVIEITYDSSRVSYEKLLDIFWRNIDPLDDRGQFCDKGEQYKSAIFYSNLAEKKLAEKSLKEIQKKFTKPIATKIIKAQDFYRAEDYHQDYYMKNPIRYKYYRNGCGRDKRLKQLWGK